MGDLAQSIDAGGQVLYFGGDLGAAAGSSDTIELRFQALDALGDALGAPVVIPPTLIVAGPPADSRAYVCDTVAPDSSLL